MLDGGLFAAVADEPGVFQRFPTRGQRPLRFGHVQIARRQLTMTFGFSLPRADLLRQFQRFFALDGEELVGAKQNRTVNLTILVAANTTLDIPVTCVEAGRWHYRARHFAAAPRAHYARGRAMKAEQVSMCLAWNGDRHADQRAVWHDIAEKSVRMAAFSETSAMAAMYEERSDDLSRIGERLKPVARQVGADAVSHGATGKGNDQVRFELTYLALSPQITIIAPWRIWDITSRTMLIDYARTHGIPVPVTDAKPYSSDRNLFHISFEGGILEDPWKEPEDDMFVLSVAPEKAPDQPRYVEIGFNQGDPVSVDGQELSPAALLHRLNEIGGQHGVGRVDVVENRYVGMKSRGVYETPGGTILHTAHRAMESITLDREVMHFKDTLTPKYAELVYYGYWFAPEREMLQAAIDQTQKHVSGTVRLKLYKGSCTVVGRKSPHSLYRPDFATFEEDRVYQQADATGFIRLNALRLRIRAMAKKQKDA